MKGRGRPSNQGPVGKPTFQLKDKLWLEENGWGDGRGVQGSHLGGHCDARRKMIEAVAGSGEKWMDSRALWRQSLQDLAGGREREKSQGGLQGSWLGDDHSRTVKASFHSVPPERQIMCSMLCPFIGS